MPTVTSLKPQKKSGRVNVYLDGEFAFGIDLDNLVRFGIKVEKEFTTEEINKIIHEAEFQKTFIKLLNYSTLRPRSEKELFDWLKRKKVPEKIYKRLFDRLKRLELLNDEKFAQWWVEQRLEFKKKSIKELKYELLQKGIDKNIIENVISSVDIDELKLAIYQYNKSKYKWNKFDSRVKIEKVSAFLVRKGFNWDIIQNVIKYMKENDNAL